MAGMFAYAGCYGKLRGLDTVFYSIDKSGFPV